MPKKPTIAIIDLDSILFQAASAGEQVWYVAKDDDGNEIGRVKSAAEYSSWLEECAVFGMDVKFNYDGDVSTLTRHTEYEILNVGRCYKAFDRLVADWVKAAGCTSWRGWMGAKAGQPVFRHKLATLNQYKPGRDETRKPYYLEEVRKYARKNSNCVTAKGLEADDFVVANTERRGDKACLISVDKDSLQLRSGWVLLYGQIPEPVYCNPDLLGTLWQSGGKVFGTGVLFTLWQMLKGDKAVDGIVGVKGYGDIKSYNALKDFNGMPLEALPEAVQVVADIYSKVYGEEYIYKHWSTGKEIKAHWKDLFEENLRLLWMLRHKDDKGQIIMEHVR